MHASAAGASRTRYSSQVRETGYFIESMGQMPNHTESERKRGLHPFQATPSAECDGDSAKSERHGSGTALRSAGWCRAGVPFAGPQFQISAHAVWMKNGTQTIQVVVQCNLKSQTWRRTRAPDSRAAHPAAPFFAHRPSRRRPLPTKPFPRSASGLRPSACSAASRLRAMEKYAHLEQRQRRGRRALAAVPRIQQSQRARRVREISTIAAAFECICIFFTSLHPWGKTSTSS